MPAYQAGIITSVQKLHPVQIVFDKLEVLRKILLGLVEIEELMCSVATCIVPIMRYVVRKIIKVIGLLVLTYDCIEI